MRLEQTRKEQEDERAIQRMQRDVDQVVAERVRPADQVIDRERKCRQRPITSRACIMAGSKIAGQSAIRFV